MNKSITGIVLSLSLACGAAEDDSTDMMENDIESWYDHDYADDTIGQARQALSAPNGYGTNDATSANCAPGPFIICDYPKDKVAYYRFMAGTCSAWWQARVVSAWNDWLVVERDLGWDIKDPASGGFADYYLSCADAGTGNLGVFQPSLGPVQGNVSAGGAYRLHNQGLIKIDAADVEALPTWATKTDVQRQRFARNVIIHEMFHSSGLGHSTATASVMRGTGEISSSDWWTTLKYPTGTELGWIEDYVP